MKQVLDLHIHSRYSRACSPQLLLGNIARVGKNKGLDIIATGDFTHPQWFSHIRKELQECVGHKGLYELKNQETYGVKFILSTEVALIYKDGGKARRIHLMIHAPNMLAVERLNEQLTKRGFNIKSDGRPILGMSAPDLVKLCLAIDPHFLIYPAHIWTPWFAVFGSKSGFDSLEECFHEETKNIFAYETGLSSDPAMNWRLSKLDKLTCLSNSDAHSLENLGREANVFDLADISYEEIYEVIKKNASQKFLYTIEFYPEEGMYHFDGHRLCNFSCSPEESLRYKNICPKCSKPLILGVVHRVSELADRPEGYVPKDSVPFKKLVGLDKIIAEARGIKNRKSIKIKAEYDDLIANFGRELYILIDLDLTKMAGKVDFRIVEGIRRVRSGELKINPGFDGQYGQVRIFGENEDIIKSQRRLL